MATIFERAADIMASNVHALLDKCENKEKMLDQNMRKAVTDLAALKESAAQLSADVQAAQRNYDAAVRRMQAEHGFAVNAMKAGDEMTAAKFLQSEAKIKAAEVDPAEHVLSVTKQNYETVRSAYNKLADDITLMKNEMNTIKSTIRTARTTEKIADMQGTGGKYAQSFSKYSEEAQHMLDTANAKLAMNTQPVDDLEDMRQKYAGGLQPDMSAALASLKAECALPDERGCFPVTEEGAAMKHAMDALRQEAGGN